MIAAAKSDLIVIEEIIDREEGAHLELSWVQRESYTMTSLGSSNERKST